MDISVQTSAPVVVSLCLVYWFWMFQNKSWCWKPLSHFWLVYPENIHFLFQGQCQGSCAGMRVHKSGMNHKFYLKSFLCDWFAPGMFKRTYSFSGSPRDQCRDWGENEKWCGDLAGIGKGTRVHAHLLRLHSIDVWALIAFGQCWSLAETRNCNESGSWEMPRKSSRLSRGCILETGLKLSQTDTRVRPLVSEGVHWCELPLCLPPLLGSISFLVPMLKWILWLCVSLAWMSFPLGQLPVQAGESLGRWQCQ